MLKKKLDEIRILSKEAEENNGEANDLVNKAKDNHINATDNYDFLGNYSQYSLHLIHGYKWIIIIIIIYTLFSLFV